MHVHAQVPAGSASRHNGSGLCASWYDSRLLMSGGHECCRYVTVCCRCSLVERMLHDALVVE